jgi:hypothetical protein
VVFPGLAPTRVLVRELSGDGHPDAVVATANAVVVLAGAGDGSFAPDPLSRLSAGAVPRDIALLDVNGDGRTDIAVAVPSRDGVALYGNDGGGHFSAGPLLAAPGAQALAEGDFNGDGRPDLVVAGSDDSLTLFLGTSSGLDSGEMVASGIAASRLARADFDGDGLADLIALDEETGAVSVLVGHGDGSFTLVNTFTIGPPAAGLALLDLTLDRLRDVVVSDPTLQLLHVGTNMAAPLAAPGDVNRDGRIDDGDRRQILAELFDGDGSDADSCGGGSVASGAEADFNGDGAISAADLLLQ